MSLFSAIASIFGGNKKKEAIGQASQAQIAAEQQGVDAITAQNALTQGGLAPYEHAGTSALSAQTDLLGLGTPGSQDAAIQALQNSPLYKSLFRTGEEAVLQNGSATGGLRGGNIQDSLANFGSDTLAKVIQQHLQDLSGLSSQGLNATGTGGDVGAQAAGSIADLFGAQGASRAGSILGKAGVTNQQYNTGAGAISDIAGQLMSSSGGSGGGGILASLANFIF